MVMNILESVAMRSETEEPGQSFDSEAPYFYVTTCPAADKFTVCNFTGPYIKWAVQADTERGAKLRLMRRGYTLSAPCTVYECNPTGPGIDKTLPWVETK